MNTILMKKAALLEVIKTNRHKHRAVFLEALAGYKLAVVKALEESLEDAKKGKKVKFSRITLVQPMDMTAEYDQTIGMLEADIDDEVKVTRDEYRQYVLDKWHWDKMYSASNNSYVTSASSRAYLANKGGAEEEEE